MFLGHDGGTGEAKVALPWVGMVSIKICVCLLNSRRLLSGAKCVLRQAFLQRGNWRTYLVMRFTIGYASGLCFEMSMWFSYNSSDGYLPALCEQFPFHN